VAQLAEKRVSNLKIGLQAGTTNTLYATWSFSASHLEEYKVVWSYSTNQNVWFEGSNSSVKIKQATYSPPGNATAVKVAVTPVSKEKETSKKVKKNGKTTTKKTKKPYWNGKKNESKVYVMDQTLVITAPGTPEAPTFTNDNRLRCSLSGYVNTGTIAVTHIVFQIVKDNTTVVATIQANYNKDLRYAAGTSVVLPRGGEYKVRCYAYNSNRNMKSDYSDFTSAVSSVPARIVAAPTLETTSDTAVRVTWTGVDHVKNYEVQYVKDHVEYFDTNPSEVQSNRPDEESTITIRDITGLDNTDGPTYYFRVRGFNDSGDGEWSPIASTPLGTTPSAPTTWSYSTTAKIGEDVILNWAHNSEDGSKQTAAQIEIIIGETSSTIDILDDASSYAYRTTGLLDNTEVLWKVRTKGAVAEYSDWSTVRTFTVYEAPSVELGLYEDVIWSWDYLDFVSGNIHTTPGHGSSLIETVTKFPFCIYAAGFPETQNVMSFAVSIVTHSAYDVLDETGTTKHIYAGDEIYSRVFVTGENTLNVQLNPFDIDLEDGVSYTLTVSVAMDSGLSAEGAIDFNVAWADDTLFPDIEVTVNYEDAACYLRPYAENEFGDEVTDVYLSVYRREYDGRFTEIAANVDGALRTTVVDPHPALDYARYRVVAMSKETGAVSYYDIPAREIGYDSIIIQWDEAWSPFDNSEDNPLYLENQPSSGMRLDLPYNVDVNVDNRHDVALVEYIGRENPVSYYGTQRGESSRWSTEIPKDDAETLYTVRKLAAHMGDVYVREPSGIGYWANVQISYNIQHSKPTIPITITISRVDGGV